VDKSRTLAVIRHLWSGGGCYIIPDLCRVTDTHPEAASSEVCKEPDFETECSTRQCVSENGKISSTQASGIGSPTADVALNTGSSGSILLKIDALVVSVLSTVWRELLTGFAAYGQCMGAVHLSNNLPTVWHEKEIDELQKLDKRP